MSYTIIYLDPPWSITAGLITKRGFAEAPSGLIEHLAIVAAFFSFSRGSKR